MLSAEVSKILELHVYLVLDEVVVEKGGVIYPPLPDYLTQERLTGLGLIWLAKMVW